MNPLRYRGYVYDTESKLYYLQSRYYDPELGRFINSDSFASTGQGVLGNNMFAYCGNDPINYVDTSGHWSQWLEDKLEDFKEWLEEEKEEASSNADITLVVGGTGNAAFGAAASGSSGLTIDTKGNVGRITTTNGGGGFPGLGVGLFVSINNTPTIFAQEGLGTAVGASGGPWVVAVGGDYNMIIDTKNAKTYHGGTLNVSYGFYPTVVEIHGEVGYSWVEGVNLFTVAIDAIDYLLSLGKER